MKNLRSLALLPLALAVASCGDSTSQNGGGCDSPISSVTISSGTTPTFEWSPACTVAQLVVTDITETDPDKKLKWSVTADQNIIRPVVTYGVAPANTIQTHGPDPLVGPINTLPGHNYVLTLSAIQGDGTYFVVVNWNFTP
ncbi:MAG TPA: hypothetical protein VFO96_04130 [Gemmatimonadales bacterium]|jgi:hypothetical protein|nr:hypothetical protein [Gemmatimonadales bacterium]